MSGREHMFLRALAVCVLVSLHFLPRGATTAADKLARQQQATSDQRMAEERGSAAGAGTASTVLALTP